MKRRLLAITLAGAIGGAAIALVFARIATRALASERLALLVAHALPQSALEACRNGGAPHASVAEVEFDFYDHDGAALTPGAPPIDTKLLARLHSSSERQSGRLSLAPLESHVIIQTDAGACAFAQARWRSAGGPGGRAALAVIACIAGIVASLALAMHHWIIRPLLERVEERRIALEWLLGELTHDVKTPLASLQFALDEIAELTPSEILPTLRRALNDVMYMRSLTDNLRLAQRLDGGTFDRTPTDLAALVTRVVARSEPFAVRRAMELRATLDAVPTVTCDPVAVEQAVTNLIENAIAHNSPQTVITVRLLVTDSIELRIEDNGEGVAPDVLPTLGFRMVDTRARERDSRHSGRGLAITRAVCERHGWHLQFEAARPNGLLARIVIARGPPSG